MYEENWEDDGGWLLWRVEEFISGDNVLAKGIRLVIGIIFMIIFAILAVFIFILGCAYRLIKGESVL